MTERLFPIMLGRAQHSVDLVPWAMLEPHEEQANRNHGQTLKRLAERGGLSPSEALAVLEDRRWRSMDPDDAERLLRLRVAAWRLEIEARRE